MTAFLNNIRHRSGLIGAVVLMFAATACMVAMSVTLASLLIAFRAGAVSAEQINLLSLTIGLVGTFTGFVGALLASPERHGRATDPATTAARVVRLPPPDETDGAA